MAGSYGRSMFIFLRNWQFLLKWLTRFTSSQQWGVLVLGALADAWYAQCVLTMLFC